MLSLCGWGSPGALLSGFTDFWLGGSIEDQDHQEFDQGAVQGEPGPRCHRGYRQGSLPVRKFPKYQFFDFSQISTKLTI